MLTWYPTGAEIPGWRKLLHENGVRHMALSYIGLTRRIKDTAAWRIAGKFPADVAVLLESGAFTINKSPDDYDIQAVFESYLTFAEANADSVALITDFDIDTWSADQRDKVRVALDEVSVGKFLPIWHPNEGITGLQDLAATYHRIGVPQTALGGRDLTPLLTRLARDGVHLHGVAMTQMDAMRSIPWTSVASSSWLSPAQYGDTIVWTGRELKRYPRRYKDQARKRHRTVFHRAGFDSEAIEAGDSTELLKLSIWSWTQYVNHINGGVVNQPPETDPGTNTEPDHLTVDQPPTEKRNSEPRQPRDNRPPTRRDKATLPGARIVTKTVKELDDDGVRRERNIPLLSTNGQTNRVCDSCFLAGKCPQYDPGAECAYDLPVEARTRDQLARLYEAIIEMQVQRLFFARFSEEIEGGYPDPNVGTELDRLQKMLKAKQEMDAEGFTLTVKAQSRNTAESGMFSRIFGDSASQAARAIDPVPAEDVAAQLGIVEAEIVETSS
jgi:hypothetical protein